MKIHKRPNNNAQSQDPEGNKHPGMNESNAAFKQMCCHGKSFWPWGV